MMLKRLRGRAAASNWWIGSLACWLLWTMKVICPRQFLLVKSGNRSHSLKEKVSRINARESPRTPQSSTAFL